MTSKHTEGPWHLLGAYSEMNGERPYDIAAGGTSIALVTGHLPRRYEGLSNARLIAAAPELLAALKAIVRESDRLSESEFLQAAAAIARAEGGAK